LTGGKGAGVAPFRGLIWLPEKYAAGAAQAIPANAALIGHEFAHALQRDLPEFPDGWGPAGSWIFAPEGRLDPVGFEYGSPLGGEFTLYMEVQSNIVQKTIQYDQLHAQWASLPPGSLGRQGLEARMQALADSLATYTGEERNAAAYVVKESGGHAMYVGAMASEVILGARIPEGGWQHFLAEQGFSEQAIEHIEQIAAQGTPIQVPIARYLQDAVPSTTASSTGGQSTPGPIPSSQPPGVRAE